MTPFNIARVVLVAELLFLFGIIVSVVPDAWSIWIALIGLVWSMVAGHVFIIRYAITQPWYRDPVGRHMMAFMGGMTLILDLTAVAYFYPALPWRSEMRIFVWTLLPFLFTWRTVILFRVKHYSRQN